MHYISAFIFYNVLIIFHLRAKSLIFINLPMCLAARIKTGTFYNQSYPIAISKVSTAIDDVLYNQSRCVSPEINEVDILQRRESTIIAFVIPILIKCQCVRFVWQIAKCQNLSVIDFAFDVKDGQEKLSYISFNIYISSSLADNLRFLRSRQRP